MRLVLLDADVIVELFRQGTWENPPLYAVCYMLSTSLDAALDFRPDFAITLPVRESDECMTRNAVAPSLPFVGVWSRTPDDGLRGRNRTVGE